MPENRRSPVWNLAVILIFLVCMLGLIIIAGGIRYYSLLDEVNHQSDRIAVQNDRITTIGTCNGVILANIALGLSEPIETREPYLQAALAAAQNQILSEPCV